MDAPLSHPIPYLTPPQIARRLGVKPSKVNGWVNSGELVGIDVSERRSNRPRWRISPESFAAFLAARSSRPATLTTSHRRPRKQETVIQFF
jgi:hypothetical protein